MFHNLANQISRSSSRGECGRGSKGNRKGLRCPSPTSRPPYLSGSRNVEREPSTSHSPGVFAKTQTASKHTVMVHLMYHLDWVIGAQLSG